MTDTEKPKEFHPAQKAAHLMNKWNSNAARRDAAVAEMVRLRKLTDALASERHAIESEMREHLPKLRGFRHTEKSFKKLLGID